MSEPRSATVYLLNSPVLTSYGEWRFDGPITVEQARELLGAGFVSAVGHAATAQFLSKQLGLDVAVNRTTVQMAPGDRALVLCLKERLPEGKVLSQNDMHGIAYELGMLTRLR